MPSYCWKLINKLKSTRSCFNKQMDMMLCSALFSYKVGLFLFENGELWAGKKLQILQSHNPLKGSLSICLRSEITNQQRLGWEVQGYVCFEGEQGFCHTCTWIWSMWIPCMNYLSGLKHESPKDPVHSSWSEFVHLDLAFMLTLSTDQTIAVVSFDQPWGKDGNVSKKEVTNRWKNTRGRGNPRSSC